MAKKKEPTQPNTKLARESSRFLHDGRRKHRHWEVTIFYHDGKRFSRVYIDRERAHRFAERQKKSPIVRAAKVQEVDL
ncbi:MAG: hypothetical protein KGL59_09865 [Acidobacteriota bacterium]|nr:hypothetical protein [Acidobacteriota bacterium]